jgi:hypothetical protein
MRSTRPSVGAVREPDDPIASRRRLYALAPFQRTDRQRLEGVSVLDHFGKTRIDATCPISIIMAVDQGCEL